MRVGGFKSASRAGHTVASLVRNAMLQGERTPTPLCWIPRGVSCAVLRWSKPPALNKETLLGNRR